jgi:hypothetical protein
MKLFVQYQGSMRELDAAIVWQNFCGWDARYGVAVDAVGVGVLVALMLVESNITSTPSFKVAALLVVLHILLRETGAYQCGATQTTASQATANATATAAEAAAAAAATVAAATPPSAVPAPPAPITETSSVPLQSAPPSSSSHDLSPLPPPPPPQRQQPPQQQAAYNPRAFWQGCVGSATRRLPSLKSGRGYAHYIPDSQTG